MGTRARFPDFKSITKSPTKKLKFAGNLNLNFPPKNASRQRQYLYTATAEMTDLVFSNNAVVVA